MSDDWDRETELVASLRAIDGPVDVSAEIDERIEAAMLARFDAVAASDVANGSAVIVPLDEQHDQVAPSRPFARSRRGRALSVAAVLVVLVAGLVAVLNRSGSLPAAPAASTVPSAADETTLFAQLEGFCAEWVVPAREADDGWLRTRTGSEARGLAIVSIERAAAAMERIDAPLGTRLALHAQQVVDAGTEARLATTLNRDDGDDAVDAAFALLYRTPEIAEVPTTPASCLP